MKTKYSHHPTSLQIAAVLLCLTLLSFHMMSGLFARFATEGQANDSARVAAFTVRPNESYTTPAIQFTNMAPGETQTYTFTLSSASEVAVNCSVAVSTTGNLPLNFQINGINTPSNSSTLTNIVALAPLEEEVTLTLDVTWGNEENSMSYLNEIDAVSLTIVVTQID